MSTVEAKSDSTNIQAHNLDAKLVWRNWALKYWFPVLLLMLVLFYDTGAHMVRTWWVSASFNHGFIIPLICGWLVYEKLPDLYRVKPEFSWIGVLGMIAGGALWFLGEIASVDVISEAGFVGMIQASVLAIFGKKALKTLFFPVAYLAFAVPFGDQFVPILQDFTAEFIVAGIKLLDIPVQHDGIFISIPAGNFLVAEACSGVRFMIAMVAVGTFFAYVGFNSIWRKATIILLSFIIPIIGNGFRALFLVLIAHWTDMEYATGYDHIIYGYVFFTFILLIFLAIGWRFSDVKQINARQNVEEEDSQINISNVKGKLLSAPLIAVYFVVVSTNFAGAGINAEVNSAAENAQIFENHTSWRRSSVADARWTPIFANADKHERGVFRHSSGQVSVYAAHYFNQIDGKELVQKTNAVGGQDWENAAKSMLKLPSGFMFEKVIETRINHGGQRRLAWTIYYIDGSLIADNYTAKLDTVVSRLRGRGAPGGALLISVIIITDEAAARETLKDFVLSIDNLELYFASQVQ